MNYYITNFPQFLKSKKDKFNTNVIINENKQDGNIFFFIDGYIIPRMEIFDEYKNQNQYNLLFNLYKKYGEKFIEYIKGVFNIVIIDKSKFLIYNDHHAIKRVFTYNDAGCFFISNDLKTIREHFSLSINYENAAIFCLLNHFFNGYTIFDKITFSNPASKIKYSNNQITTSFYWKPNELFVDNESSKKNKFDFSIFWEKLLNNYVEYIKPKQISVTLTGGNDSRMVLAPLLNKNYSLHAFSFGNPKSFDVVIAKQIARKSKLNYNYYYLIEPSKEWLYVQVSKLIDIGNTLINFHRAHRNDALEKETDSFPETEMIFTGLMGGEYLKEPYYNDIVLPKLFNELIKNKNKQDNLNFIKRQLKIKGIKTDNIDLNKVYEKIISFLNDNICSNQKKTKFILTYYFYGCAHHSQDSNIFNYHCQHVVNPFMDIDFLEKMSTSNNFYVNKKGNLFSRLFHSKLYIEITNDLAPELSNIPYAKRGQYTARELLNKPFIYLFKRIKYLIIKDKLKYPSNFPMGDWLYQFSKEELDNIHPELCKILNNNTLTNKLESIRSKTNEEHWHPITNPINLSLYLKAYEQN
jgi:hypothetical protein